MMMPVGRLFVLFSRRVWVVLGPLTRNSRLNLLPMVKPHLTERIAPFSRKYKILTVLW